MKFKRAISFLLAVVLSVGMMSMVCLPAVAEDANQIFIINPKGNDGDTATENGVTGTVYTSYDAFEKANPEITAADVYFVTGSYGDFTVTKKVNLYGPYKEVDPNVKQADILTKWKRRTERGTGEAVLKGTVEIATEGKGNDVLMDGFAIGEAGKIWVSCSKEDHDVTIQNIFVSSTVTFQDYCIWASPELTENEIPKSSNYPMTFCLKNVFADLSDKNQTAGSFIRHIAASKVELDNILYANTTTMFMCTTGTNSSGYTFEMRDSFIYNCLPETAPSVSLYSKYPKTVILHDNVPKAASRVSYENNVFYNAHGVDNGYTIYFDRLMYSVDERIFRENTFVTDKGAAAPINVVRRPRNDSAADYNLSQIVVKENRMVGYNATISSNDDKGEITYVGKIDLSDNFTWIPTDANETLDFSTTDKCQVLTGVPPQASNGTSYIIPVDVSGPYYTNFDKTISTDMLRVTGVDLDSAQINIADKKIKGILTEDNYVPKFTFTCGNDIDRTVTIKNKSTGADVDSINAAGTYLVTVVYESQDPVTFEFEVEKATAYAGAGYVFDPNATKNTAYYWDGGAKKFTYGTNLFSDLTKLFDKADAANVDVPQVLLPPITIEGDYTITHSCEVLGYHHGIDPIIPVADPTKENQLSDKRGIDETILTGKWTITYADNNMTFVFDGITMEGDGRFVDSGDDKTNEKTTFKNIIFAPGAFSADTKENARFGTKANSEKTLTFKNIWMSDITMQKATGTSESYLFYFNGTNVLLDNVYVAHTDLAICGNAKLQSGTDLTKDLSLTIQGTKFYDVTSTDEKMFRIYEGKAKDKHFDHSKREHVKFSFQNTTFYNCSRLERNPNLNAVFVLLYPYQCYEYEFIGNTFIDDRELIHMMDTPEKNRGTDIYTQFLHFSPKNHQKGSAYAQRDLEQSFTIENNRFIGRNTVINSENDLFTNSIELENNFFVSYDTVQSVKSSTDWIYSLKGENPNKVMNVRNTKNGVENYYLDYAMQSSTAITGAEESFARVDKVNHIMEKTQTSGQIKAPDWKQTATTDLLRVNMFTDAAYTDANILNNPINCNTLDKGTHIYYIRYLVVATGDYDYYTLVLHTATTDLTYSREAVLYDPLAEGLPAGIKWYREIDGTLYAFETGKTVFGDMDDIVIHTQETTAEVLLPAGDYTSDELSTVESVNYICDTDVKVNGEAVTNSTTVPVKKEKIKVVCLGDSLTFGNGCTDSDEYAYPAQLQKLLDNQNPGDYDVLNFGRGGSVGANVVTYGYESLWNYSLALRENPDIVILAFGMNDAVKSTHQHIPIDYFKEEMLELIAELKALPSKPIIYMTTATNVQKNTERPEEYLEDLRKIQRETVTEAGIRLLDAYGYSKSWLDDYTPAQIYASNGADQVHFGNLGYQLLAKDYFEDGIDWQEQGAHQPEDAEVTITFSLGKVAELDGQVYSDLKSALKAAAAKTNDGNKKVTVKLHKNLVGDSAVDHIVVDTAVKLDLNGNQIEANYIVGFTKSGIYDSSNEKTGRLIADKDCVAMSTKNIAANDVDYMPVYDDENNCYMFTNIKYKYRDSDKPRYSWNPETGLFKFSPKFYKNIGAGTVNTDAHALLLRGAEKSAVKVVLRLTWIEKGEDGKGYEATQNFVYNDEFVQTVINSYGTEYPTEYNSAFWATLRRNDQDANNYVISAVIVSDTGVEYASLDIPFDKPV